MFPSKVYVGNGAGDGIRTRDINLGKVALYQLSYSREANCVNRHEANVIIVARGLENCQTWVETAKLREGLSARTRTPTHLGVYRIFTRMPGSYSNHLKRSCFR